jgi:hypothetical protein
MRDNFSPSQKQAALTLSALEVRRRWRDDFRTRPGIFYMCANCEFVSDNRSYFQVDHMVSCLQGGTANRESLERVSAIEEELKRPIDKLNMELIMSANLNDQVLCTGCNQGKKSLGVGDTPDTIPQGCGYAYRLHEEDANPDHIYAGAPATIGYVKPRYR